MPIDPKEPAERPGRIIVPGGEPGDAGAEGSRIVLPPGVAREPADGVPEHPRLRPLVLVPISDGKRELLLVSDPLGVIRGQPVLGMDALPILQLLDGSVSLTDLTAAITRESKDLRVAAMVKEFVAQLDQLLMLDSPRFQEAYREVRESYHRLEIRPAAFEGRSYPAEREPLAAFLDGHFAAAAGMREAAGEPGPGRLPRAVLAPHLDPRRAGSVIGRAYLEIEPAGRDPLRVVVFGTGHSLIDDRVALTRKHFETPLGKVPCDTDFVDAVAARLGDSAYAGELAHREEHSIEFQAVYLRHRFRDRRITLVPILCGGFHALLEEGRTPREDATVETLVEAVREAERALGGATVYVAGADLSHVGPRFGDPPLDESQSSELEAKDRAALEAARRGDADAWFHALAEHEDSTRICGYAPIYALLRCAEPGEGRLLRYEQSKEQDGSVVSVAAVCWP
jgi:AmmeMemoRadiSam system protein B